MTIARADINSGRARVLDEVGRPIADCERFLERARVRGLSSHTVNAYAYDLAIIHRWLNEIGRGVDDLQRDDIFKFISSESQREAGPKSINRRLHTLRRYYRFVVGADLPGCRRASESAEI